MRAVIKFNGSDYNVYALSGIDYGEKCLGEGTWYGTKGGIWNVGCDYGVTAGQMARGWGEFCKTGNPLADPCIVNCGIWSKMTPSTFPPPPPNDCDEAKEIYLTIYVKQPIYGQRVAIHNGKDGWDVGHTFIGVKIGTKTEKKHGFHAVNYPYWKLPLDLIGIIKVEGIIHNDIKRKFNIKKTWKISKGGCTKLKDFLETSIKYPPTFDVRKYNCTDFAKRAAKIAGIEDVPEGNQTPWPYIKIRGSNPGDMGEDLINIGGERIP